MTGDRGPEYDPPQGEDYFRRTGSPAYPGRFESEPGPLVRPYTITGGRTHPRYQLAIEALVSTASPERDFSSLTPELRAICELCRVVRSVAEVSALLQMPLGVARVLVADLANDGVVYIYQTAVQEDGQPDIALLERVLSGLHQL